MSSDERRRSGVGAAFVLLIVVGAIAKFWVWILVVLGVVVLGVVLSLLLLRADLRRAKQLGDAAAIATRADEQHAQILAGDDRGIYGMFPPAKPPTVWPLERAPRVGENWAEYLAETRKRALAG